MRVLADFHHEHLWESLQILIEDRLGWELYRPIGLEWYHEDFWEVYPHISTAKQYLEIREDKAHFRKLEPGERLGGDCLRADSGELLRYANWNATTIDEGVWITDSPCFPRRQYKGIELEAFKNTDFDIIIASMTQHKDRFLRLKELHQPNAKLVFQVGNNWPLGLLSGYPNILTSAKTLVPQCQAHNINHCYYRQEFDTELFKPCDPDNIKMAANLMHYMQEVPLLHAVEAAMPDWTFRWHGAGNREGSVGPADYQIAEVFKEIGFVFHNKREGDGYGYNIHHGMSRGRPIICKLNDFNGQTPEDILEESTCVNIENKSVPEIVDTLNRAADEYPELQQRVLNKFQSVVNFDTEFDQVVKPFMENLV